MPKRISATIAALSIVFSGNVLGLVKQSFQLQLALARNPQSNQFIWVEFVDKGSTVQLEKFSPTSLVTQKAIERRRKALDQDQLLSFADLPVSTEYVAAIQRQVGNIRQVSRWFNMVSTVAAPEQIARLEQLPFVKGISLVARSRRMPVEDIGTSPTHPTTLDSPFLLDYGPSLPQMQLINVPPLHDAGNYGQGVIVCVLDNGFRLLNHEAFASMNILATYDFVDHKVSVVPNNTSPAFGSHGINTLSALGGRKDGQLIGPAFGATFLLARTENDSSETPIEEDNWVAAIEWAESLGVDVTSTSLGYLAYDPPYTSWTWQDLDGNTTLITRAADMAVARGVVVVNSAGNNGLNTSHNTLNAPADGDEVLAIGAVDASGSRASFSSVGPTTSNPGRIKPDLMATGVNVIVASGSVPTGYISNQGTSLSCPLAAGVVALILNAAPSTTPAQVAEALRNTGSGASTPDNLMGWGIINAVAAVNYLTLPISLPTTFLLEQNFPNPFNPRTRIRYRVPEQASVFLSIYNVLGQLVRTLVNEVKPASSFEVEWDGRNDAGDIVATGAYYYRLSARSLSGDHAFNEDRKMIFLK
ncbi:MAG TPA: S8 family serine peptidase [Bacteroidota bacterium]